MKLLIVIAVAVVALLAAGAVIFVLTRYLPLD